MPFTASTNEAAARPAHSPAHEAGPQGCPAGLQWRQAGPPALAKALLDARADTLATFHQIAAGLRAQGQPRLSVPYAESLNPPLWELGHLGWFQEYWLQRNPFEQRQRGALADPEAKRLPALRANADALYDSSHVEHTSRWHLPLPNADETLADLHNQLEQSLSLLAALAAHSQAANSTPSDAQLYFFRLVLAHEDMHHEAALYMAQSLGLPITDARWQPVPLPEPCPALHIGARSLTLGSGGHRGFAFDNELAGQTVHLAEFEIDAQALRWKELLPALEAQAMPMPAHLRRHAGQWQVQRWGEWKSLGEAISLAEPACHINHEQAQAWCQWAGRRLPTEAEWECAATSLGPRFAWGAVWEWTASAFEPYPGFVAHPYRDYSAPWFGGSRQVLRGASFGTQPRMRHARYRNYYTPQRGDIFAGFRSCAL